jgi:hypothetical protein
MIAGLAFSPAAALIGAIAGTLGLFFGLVTFADVSSGPLSSSACSSPPAALPAWWLTRLAWLARPAEAGETASADNLVWYPAGRLAAWIAGLSAAAAAVGLIAATARAGSFDAFVTDAAARVQPVIEQLFGGSAQLPGGLNAGELARTFIMATAPLMAAWTAAGLALNLWLAAEYRWSPARCAAPGSICPKTSIRRASCFRRCSSRLFSRCWEVSRARSRPWSSPQS